MKTAALLLALVIAVGGQAPAFPAAVTAREAPKVMGEHCPQPPTPMAQVRRKCRSPDAMPTAI